MGKFYESIPPELVPWLLKQQVFWVASAPLSPEGHVNVSPKGVRDSFHVLSPTRVWYQDLSGSGYGSPEYDALIPPDERRPGSRAAIVIDVHKVGTSCGYAVPYYEFKGHRQVLLDSRQRERADQADPGAHAEKGLKAYWEEKNLRSIDGLPGMAYAPKVERTPDCRDEMRRADTPLRGGKAASANGHANGSAKTNGVGGGVLVKTVPQLERQRVQEWAVAFALGLAVAAVYVQLAHLL
ncbi:hypothetical protein FKP32DRAFT_1574308 [Trametes sanguinea]|nr:hypothetical protein FKP32DRAFT_1574308 [Trametes sanguinea]